MSYGNEIYKQAWRELDLRRIRAESDAQRVKAEVFRRIPEAAEIDHQISSVGVKLARVVLGNNKKGSADSDDFINQVKQSNMEAQRMMVHLLTANGFTPDALDVHYTCQLCRDRGTVNGQLCICIKRLLSKLAVERLNTDCPMELCSFSSFYLDYYPEECKEKMSQILQYCKDYVDKFFLGARNIFMQGLTGLGKTHLSLSIAKEIVEKGYNVAYGSVVNYLLQIEKEHFGRSDSSRDTLKLLVEAELLILDDFGSEYESSFYNATVYNIINTRQNRGVPTIISSNLSIKDLQSRYGDRIISRITGMYDLLFFVGNDIRQIRR